MGALLRKQKHKFSLACEFNGNILTFNHESMSLKNSK